MAEWGRDADAMRLGRHLVWGHPFRSQWIKSEYEEERAVSNNERKSSARRYLLTSTALALMIGAADVALAEQSSYTIPAQPLGDALQAFGDQTGLQIFYAEKDVVRVDSRGVSGAVSAEQAIAELLNGTGLVFSFEEEDLIVIRPAAEAAARDGRVKVNFATPEDGSRLAQMTEEGNRQISARGRDRIQTAGADLDEDEGAGIETFVVTGTLLPRANDGASPVFVFDREAIDRTGFATTDQLIQSLPQNFGGGPNESTVFGPEASGNFGLGSSINLRGLGADSTLVLINGNRLAAAGGFEGDFVDISAIPLSALERVEVLTDGASAVYGTDAIAGVVNFILRDDYEGAETRLRYGTVTDGGLDEFLVGQTFGTAWEGGNFLASYEYYNRDRLGSEERSFTSNSDLRSLGGDDFSNDLGTPANVLDPATGFRSVAFAVPRGQDGTSLTPGDFLSGTVNRGNIREGVDVLPDTARHTLFLTARQELTSALEVFGEFQFGRRESEARQGAFSLNRITVTDTNPFFVSPFPGLTSNTLSYNFIDDFGPIIRESDVTNYRGVFGTHYEVTDTWTLEIVGTYNREETETLVLNQVNSLRLAEALGNNIGVPPGSDLFPSFDPLVDGFFNPYSDGTNTPRNVLDFVQGAVDTSFLGELWTARVQADGEVVQLPGGAVRLAIGAEYREESFDRRSIGDVTTPVPTELTANTSSGRRDVVAVFGELLVPVVGSNNAMPGVDRFEVTVSGRFEDYSDFGSSANPKVGAVWSPFSGFTLRGTYGTSFKAPKITDADEKGQIFVGFPFVPDPLSPSGFSSALFLTGSNPDLASEESTAWTVGAQINPPALDRLRIDFTYFDIDFENRLAQPPNPFGFLFDPDTFGAFFERDPGEAVVQAFYDSPFFLGAPPVPASDVDVILDGRVTNFAETHVNGFDFALAYGTDTGFGAFDFGLNANYIMNFNNAFIPGQALQDQVDTVNNPVDFRLRGSLSWNRGVLGATVFVNYTDSFEDNLSTPERAVDSWTTVDLRLQYDISDDNAFSWLDDTVFSISVQNLFDENPPFVNNPAGIAYDPNNASALGRFLSFQVTKTW